MLIGRQCTVGALVSSSTIRSAPAVPFSPEPGHTLSGQTEGEVVRSSGPIRDKKIRCVLAHEHVLLRQGVRRLLEDAPDIAVEAEAGNAAETLRAVSERRPDLVITDPRLNGHDTEIF